MDRRVREQGQKLNSMQSGANNVPPSLVQRIEQLTTATDQRFREVGERFRTAENGQIQRIALMEQELIDFQQEVRGSAPRRDARESPPDHHLGSTPSG